MIPIYHAALFAGNGGWRFLPIFTVLNCLVFSLIFINLSGYKLLSQGRFDQYSRYTSYLIFSNSALNLFSSSILASSYPSSSRPLIVPLEKSNILSEMVCGSFLRSILITSSISNRPSILSLIFLG